MCKTFFSGENYSKIIIMLSGDPVCLSSAYKFSGHYSQLSTELYEVVGLGGSLEKAIYSQHGAGLVLLGFIGCVFFLIIIIVIAI